MYGSGKPRALNETVATRLIDLGPATVREKHTVCVCVCVRVCVCAGRTYIPVPLSSCPLHFRMELGLDAITSLYIRTSDGMESQNSPRLPSETRKAFGATCVPRWHRRAWSRHFRYSLRLEGVAPSPFAGLSQRHTRARALT